MKRFIVSVLIFWVLGSGDIFAQTVYLNMKSFFILKAGSSKQAVRNWSSFQGLLKWDEAKSKCETQGMRLPLRSELAEIYGSEEKKAWSRDGEIYWTGEEDERDDRTAYIVMITDGQISVNFKEGYLASVRCIRK